MSCQDQGDSGKKRITYQKNDDEILAHVIKNAEGGRLWKIIKEGASTAQQKFVAWETVTKLFNNATGYDLDRKQVRTKFQRIKNKKKKEADKKRLEERQYTRSCLATGGGPGPSSMPDNDGDNETDLSFNEEPTDTTWNSFTSSAVDRENIPPQSRNTPSTPQVPNPVFRQPGGLRVRFPLRLDSPLDPMAPLATSRQAGQRENAQGQGQQGTQVDAGVSRDQTGLEQILLVTENGAHSVKEVPNPAQTQKTMNKKVVNKKDMNDAATNYYTEMLIIQKEVSLKKIELLEKKIKNETLKEEMLKKQLGKEGGSDDILESSSGEEGDGLGDEDDSFSNI